MTKETREVYVAKDGEVFRTEEQCTQHNEKEVHAALCTHVFDWLEHHTGNSYVSSSYYHIVNYILANKATVLEAINGGIVQTQRQHRRRCR
jgi:hypothetical protein